MKRLLFIVLLTLVAGFVVWPQVPGNYIPFGSVLPGNPGIHIGDFQRQGAKLGLDLQGGTQLTLQADMSQVSPDQQADALKGVVNVIQRRVNAYGVAEPEIQTQGTDRIIVQLPGVRDIEEAKKLIGQTAKLEFMQQDAKGNWVPATGQLNGQTVALTGTFLVPGHQQVTFQGNAGLPEVAFEFNSDGAQLFQQITSGLVGKPLGIFLDGQEVSAPTVQAVLSSNGVITGLSLEQARLLALQLNAGALPVPVSIQEERTVDATLGADSVHKSIVAGEIAMLVVVAFMLLYYRVPGLAASLALIVYALVTLAIFKVIPVTLTLAGIAGFILSVGMAVDANILIFERMKEELRSGKTIAAAIRAGEDRAWPSIRDSNTSTLITCGVLYFFGQQFGATIIMGFALVLGIGVVVSLFSAIVVTRTFLELILARRWAHSPRLFGMEISSAQIGGAAAPTRRAVAAGSRS
ncbi:MAG: protein translocase subunit SecD [Chloroflexi bacterium]|nr:protein translocase subunit SecD [Chloroflexota bacterium]MBV9547033.1 protein translocase subunit SecD [Chloroflexota bacterium]